MSYTDVFGGGVANPADVQYRAFNLTADTEMQWPASNEDQPNVVARLMAITPSGGTWTLTMPPANQAANGENTVIRNLGAVSFNVVGNTGVAIATLAPGEAKYIYVTDNTTVAGTWSVFTFGTGTSAADASALAGAGLEASANLLRQALNVTFVAAAYTAGLNDRATVIEYTGGSDTLSLAAAATLGDNWFVYVTNQGSGTFTINPNGSETIDGSATATILQDESCMVVCDGVNFVTIGRGRSVSFTTTAASINVAGSGAYTLGTGEAAAQIQTFTGTLTGDRQVNYGTNPGFWFAENATTGSYTLTLRVNSSDTGVVIAAGTSSIFRSDGVNLTQAVSTNAGTITQINTGTGLTGGPITSSGTIAVANTAVTPGSYGGTSSSLGLTVNAQGQITAASNNTLGVAGGGTGVTSITAKALVLGNGTSPINTLSPGASGTVPISNGTDWLAGGPPAPLASGRNFAGRTNATNPNYQVDFTADELVVKDGSGIAALLSTVSVTADITASGVNGLDTGAEASNTWYYLWVIWNGTTTAALLSASATAPTMPSGYTYKALVGAVRNDNSSNFIPYRQTGKTVFYINRQSVLAGGTAGTETTVSLSGFVPPVAQQTILSALLFVPASINNQATLDIRVITGNVYYQLQAFSVLDTTNGYDSAQVTVPNISQQVIYINSSTSAQSSIWVNAFTLPGGGC